MAEIKERPILFSAPMVRAILDGQKTQTRRVVKPQPSCMKYLGVGGALMPFKRVAPPREMPSVLMEVPIACPYGQPGDRLWVKETHRFDIAYDALKPTEMDSRAAVWFEADAAVIGGGVPGKTRVSLHMQRRFSRILLEIVSIRVERLNDCSEGDALAEGVQPIFPDGKRRGPNHYTVDIGGECSAASPTAVGAYQMLWEIINGEGSWSANPWVWVVEFKRVEAKPARGAA